MIINHGSDAFDAHPEVPVSTVVHWTGATAGTARPCTGRQPGTKGLNGGAVRKPWQNHGKTMVKPWSNQDVNMIKSMVKRCGIDQLNYYKSY